MMRFVQHSTIVGALALVCTQAPTGTGALTLKDRNIVVKHEAKAQSKANEALDVLRNDLVRTGQVESSSYASGLNKEQLLNYNYEWKVLQKYYQLGRDSHVYAEAALDEANKDL